jgi:hypothetical protein
MQKRFSTGERGYYKFILKRNNKGDKIMEPKFLNSFKLTTELFREIFNDLNRLYRIVLLLVGIAFLAFAIVSVGGYYVVTVIFFVFAGYFIYMAILGYLLGVNRAYKKMLMQGCILENIFTTQFRANELNDAKSTYDYAQIKKVRETKELLILKTGNNTIIPLKKDCFTTGTYEEFKKFICEKCVNARIFYK